MNVNDIAGGSEIKIHASINKHNVVLMTHAIFGVSSGLLVKPMEYFGKYLQFLEPSLVEVMNKRDGRLYRFMSTSITPVKTRYGNFHLIRCSSEIAPENTRKSERFSIGKLGIFRINGNTTNIKNCIVHDISMRGMSIIIDNSTKCKVGDQIDVSFIYGEVIHNYNVSAVVVRMFAVSGNPALGCKISNMGVDLIELLNAKKSQKMSPEAEMEAATNLNPAISKEQQQKEVEQDLLSQIRTQPRPTQRAVQPQSAVNSQVPSKPAAQKAPANPLDPSNLEHVDRPEKTIREQKKQERRAKIEKALDDLLDINGI